MLPTTEVLDEAFDRLGQWGFDEPDDGYVNHGPMACEALDALGLPAEVDRWSRLDRGTPPVEPVTPARDWAWTDALGDPRRAGEWMGLYERAIDEQGWPAVLEVWLPRLLPALGTALFHGAIRSAHAVRAIGRADTPARRAELVRALGYWSALAEPGPPPGARRSMTTNGGELAAIRAAARAARCYLAKPNIISLHGVTAAMAVAVLVPHVNPDAASAALAQLDDELDQLFVGVAPVEDPTDPGLDDETLVAAAVTGGEAHAVKLVEASQRGYAALPDPAFRAAAERVTRRTRRLQQASATE